MLFHTFQFIFLFLPITALLFFVIGRFSRPLAALFLVACSLFFYGYWDIQYVPLLLISILINYGSGSALIKYDRVRHARLRLTIATMAIAADLLLLGYFKYYNFFIRNLNDLGFAVQAAYVILPVGISFYTFTQIAFLADAYKGLVRELNPIHYALFVTYFPHLVAGPIFHHQEMMPQFRRPATYQFAWLNLAVGGTIFIIGLLKKVCLADNLAPYAVIVFDDPSGASPPVIFAWQGALAYTLQLYFDFSGYSDMAIGISRILGIGLPLNFNSPYKARNIVEFWRRWHMTLSRFLRNYLYIPLGGNRHGLLRRYANLMVTMVLGGLWHGAGWTFLAWGALHGLYLVATHGWHALKAWLGYQARGESVVGNAVARIVTFVFVVLGWVYFRSHDLATAHRVLASMLGLNGAPLFDDLHPSDALITRIWNNVGVNYVAFATLSDWTAIGLLAGGLIIALFMPNTQEIMRRYRPYLDSGRTLARKGGRLVWRPSPAWACTFAFGGFAVLVMMASARTKLAFLYFQF